MGVLKLRISFLVEENGRSDDENLRIIEFKLFY